MFPYDALETPYELPGSLLGVVEPSPSTSFPLPLPVNAGLRAHPEGLTPEDMEAIIGWAEMVWQEMAH